LRPAYRTAPFFRDVFPFLREILACSDRNLTSLNVNLLKQVVPRIGIRTPIMLSSMLEKDDDLRGQERVINMCERVGATHYVNLSVVSRYMTPRRLHNRA
jgi:WbqC-like protein family